MGSNPSSGYLFLYYVVRIGGGGVGGGGGGGGGELLSEFYSNWNKAILKTSGN